MAVVGKGIAWVFRQRKGRIAQLESRVELLAGEHAHYLRQIDCLGGVCFLLIDDISQHRPDAPVIGQAKALIGTNFPDLLKRAFPLEAPPTEMVATILRAK
jgi:hypothetical protein